MTNRSSICWSLSNLVPLTMVAIAGCWLAPSAVVAQNNHPNPTGNAAAAASRPNDITAQQPQTIQVLAIVNGEQISRQQIAQSCLKRHGKQVLESIIDRQLVADECKRQNVTITVQDIDQEIERRAKGFNMTRDRYVELLQKERNLSPDRLKNEIIWSELALRRLAAQQIQVDQAEIDREMESEYGPKVQVRAIVLDDLEKANQILAQAKADPDEFGTLAKDHSIDSNSAAYRGMMPPIRRHSGEPEFEEVAFNLQPGEISRVIDITDHSNPTAHQYVILKCERIYPAAEVSAQERPLVEQRLRDKISESKLADAATGLFERLQNQSQIVNVLNNPELRQKMPGVAATLNGTNITLNYLGEECIARYGDEVLETEINRTLILQALRERNKTVANEDVQAEIAALPTPTAFPISKSGSNT